MIEFYKDGEARNLSFIEQAPMWPLLTYGIVNPYGPTPSLPERDYLTDTSHRCREKRCYFSVVTLSVSTIPNSPNAARTVSAM